MIESAHVGVGIMGKEGNQAANFADFAINQFKDLRCLMFWHGSNFLCKFTTFVNLNVSKTTIFGLSSVFYNAFAMYSAVNYVSDIMFATYPSNCTQIGY